MRVKFINKLTLFVAFLALSFTAQLSAFNFNSATVQFQDGFGNDIASPDEFRLAFISSASMQAISKDISDYNHFVNGIDPTTGTFSGTVTPYTVNGNTIEWKAIGSTKTVDARDNTGTNPDVSTGVPIFVATQKSGTEITVAQRIAKDNADLWDFSIQRPIDFDENINNSIGIVYTGTRAGGSFGGTGDPGFELGDGMPGDDVRFGSSFYASSRWLAFNTFRNTGSEQIYAMSGVIQNTPIPEPSTYLLLGSTLCLALAARRKKRVKARI